MYILILLQPFVQHYYTPCLGLKKVKYSKIFYILSLWNIEKMVVLPVKKAELAALYQRFFVASTFLCISPLSLSLSLSDVPCLFPLSVSLSCHQSTKHA